jgi:glycosyltransferase involved in cell wall biosynthesis
LPTFIVPAHNEERSIVGSVGALLGLEYPCLEVIVVNDGSDDTTMEKLRQAYKLQAARILYIAEIATAPSKGFCSLAARNAVVSITASAM